MISQKTQSGLFLKTAQMISLWLAYLLRTKVSFIHFVFLSVDPCLNFHLHRGHCLQFISRQTHVSQPRWPLPFSNTNIKTFRWEDNRSRQGTLGWQGKTIWVKWRMVEILLPAVDHVISLLQIPELSWRSPRGWQNGRVRCGNLLVSSVSPCRGFDWEGVWVFDNTAFLTPLSDSCRGIGGHSDLSLRFMPRLICCLVVGDSVWHCASASKVD